jgi:hypothetical protein
MGGSTVGLPATKGFEGPCLSSIPPTEFDRLGDFVILALSAIEWLLEGLVIDSLLFTNTVEGSTERSLLLSFRLFTAIVLSAIVGGSSALSPLLEAGLGSLLFTSTVQGSLSERSFTNTVEGSRSDRSLLSFRLFAGSMLSLLEGLFFVNKLDEEASLLSERFVVEGSLLLLVEGSLEALVGSIEQEDDFDFLKASFTLYGLGPGFTYLFEGFVEVAFTSRAPLLFTNNGLWDFEFAGTGGSLRLEQIPMFRPRTSFADSR